MIQCKIFYCLGVLCLLAQPPAYAMSKKKALPSVDPLQPKRFVELLPMREVVIDLPDERKQNFGTDFIASLQTQLIQSGRYIPIDKISRKNQGLMAMSRMAIESADYVWPASVTPSAVVGFNIRALSFSVGSRGDHLFYGFDERMSNRFNDGSVENSNEFPLKKVKFEPNWFDRFFEPEGNETTGSRAGLDLGEGFRLNALMAWASMKYMQYETRVAIDVTIDAPWVGKNFKQTIDTRGKGYYYDLAGGYQGYSAGIRVARSDAYIRSVQSAIAAAAQSIYKSVGDLPLVAQIDQVVDDPVDHRLALMGARSANYKVGARFDLFTETGEPLNIGLEVISSVFNGAVARARCLATCDQPELLLRPGLFAREAGVWPLPQKSDQVQPLASAFALRSAVKSQQELQGTVSTASVSIDLPWENLAKIEIDVTLLPEDLTPWQLFLKNWVEGLLLPYRIMRYFSYDQAYHAQADVDNDDVTDTTTDQRLQKTSNIAQDEWTLQTWVDHNRKSTWAKKIGLDQKTSEVSSNQNPIVVAVIDSGIDYNHPVLHDSLWLNPVPEKDALKRLDRYGWDFISGESRAYDDQGHGTALASLVVAVAPQVKLMPLKVFSPWGVTSSASLYASFVYAVDHGAKIILCGWATRKPSEAIEEGIRYADSHGVIVIAAAGDRGDLLDEVNAYPAVLSEKYKHVLTVAAVDDSDRLVTEKGHYSNFSESKVSLAAPGQLIDAASPRVHFTTLTSTAAASALVAGALAREFAAGGTHLTLLDSAELIPSLQGKIQGARRLKIHR